MKGIDVIVEQAGSNYQIAVVRVLGQIDTTTSHELERRLQFLLKDHQFQIVIELSKVSYISSAGWGIFISEIRGIRENGGDLKLAGMIPEVAEVFELLEFHNILESFRTIQEAVEKFERPKTVPQDGRGSVNAAVLSTSERESSDDSVLAEVADDGASDVEKTSPEVDGSMGPAGATRQTTAEAGMETKLEIVDPMNPDVKEQITAEVVEEREGMVTEPMEPWIASQTRPPVSGQGAQPVDEETAAGEERTAQSVGEPATGAESVGAQPATTEAPVVETRMTEPVRSEIATPDAGQLGLRGKPDVRNDLRPKTLSKDIETAILEIVREQPEHGCLKIRGELAKRGYRKPMNPLSLFMELKRLNLETKEKRRQYADSFATVENRK